MAKEYLVDSEGYTRYDHIGEGGYAETDNAIKVLLAERTNGKELGASSLNQTKLILPGAQLVDFNQINTPELYLVTSILELCWEIFKDLVRKRL